MGAPPIPRQKPRRRLNAIASFISRLVREAARTSPARLALFVFTAMILLFTIILELPISSVSGQRTRFADALFTLSLIHI